MRILITGAKGFVGKNLVANLANIKDGKNKTRPALCIDEIMEYDIDTAPELLDEYCKKADFVFNLAGVNRPQNPEEFMQGNFGFGGLLLDTLKKAGQHLPRDAFLLFAGDLDRSVCRGRVRQKQKGG